MSNRATLYIIDYNEDPNAMIRKINANFSALNRNVDILDVAGSSGGGVGQVTHQDLGESVKKNDCHPISAITELDKILSNKAEKNTLPDYYFDTLYPQTSVYECTGEKLPESISSRGTWNKFYTEEKGGKTISYYEREK